MTDSIIRIRLAILLGLALVAVVVWMLGWSTGGGEASGRLAVTFFDVGQGDAVFIETPDGGQVLIDGGPDGSVLRQLSSRMGWLDRSLDIVIGTHPDLDHIGGLIDVLARYSIGTIVTTENTGESFAATSYAAELQAEGAEIIYARAGQVLQLGASTTLRILSPARDPAQLESNTSSIVVQLVYGETEFMLTGDAPQGIEEYLVTQHGETLESEVLKLGHHGSDTSSSALFLAAVRPLYAVVSAGKDSRYGHPHKEVLKRASTAGAQIFSTQTLGSITFYSDGETVWLNN